MRWFNAKVSVYIPKAPMTLPVVITMLKKSTCCPSIVTSISCRHTAHTVNVTAGGQSRRSLQLIRVCCHHVSRVQRTQLSISVSDRLWAFTWRMRSQSLYAAMHATGTPNKQHGHRKYSTGPHWSHGRRCICCHTSGKVAAKATQQPTDSAMKGIRKRWRGELVIRHSTIPQRYPVSTSAKAVQTRSHTFAVVTFVDAAARVTDAIDSLECVSMCTLETNCGSPKG